MKAKLRSYLRDDFLRHNVVFFFGSLMVAVLNYLYHPVMSRMLSVEDFGEVQVLFSIFGLVAVPLSIFNIIALNLYTNHKSFNSESVQQFSLLTGYVAGITALVLILATPFITTKLQLSSQIELPLVAIAILFGAFSIFGKAYLQATHKFGLTSIAYAIGAGGKLLVAVLLVSLGFNVTGAIGGLLIASILTFGFVKLYAREYIALPKRALLHFTPELRNELGFGLIVLAGTGLIIFFTLADIIFAKYLFTPEEAGLYSGISVVGRIILFLTASIAGVLLAHVKISAPVQENRKFLKQGLLLTALIGGAVLLMFILIPNFVISLLVGSEYVVLAHLLPLVGLYIFIVTLINVCISYGIALRQKSIIIIGIFGIVSTMALVSVLPASPLGLAQGFLISCVVTFIICLYIQFFQPPATTHHAPATTPH